MEKLKISFDLLKKALRSLKKSFIVIEKVKQQGDTDIIEASQDSCVQRFEYSYDSFWKFFKKHLEPKYEIEKINSPASVFKAMVQIGICSADDGKKLLEMITDRNETTHNYDAEQVREIIPRIPAYYEIMEKITSSMNFKNQMQ